MTSASAQAFKQCMGFIERLIAVALDKRVGLSASNWTLDL